MLRRLSSPWIVLVIVTVVLLVGGDALACPSCVDPRDTQRSAMLGSTIALSLIPLGFMGGVAMWLWRTHKSHAADDDSDRC